MSLCGRKLRVLVPLLAVGLATAVAVAAPAPKTPPPDPKDAALADEPAEPAIDPAKLAADAALRVKAAAQRTTSADNLKQIALAVHNHADQTGQLADNIVDKDGKPLLSWRVLLLPYIEQAPLYNMFRLDEPWDSAHNLGLLESMPKIYQSPRVTVKKTGYTVYQGFSGPSGLFGTGKALRFPGNIPDGTSATLLAVEASVAVPWTKPLDIPFDPKKNVPDFGKAYGGKPLAALCDGSTRLLDLKKIKPQTLKNVINPCDGMVLGKDWE